jgi:hypothetical protein
MLVTKNYTYMNRGVYFLFDVFYIFPLKKKTASLSLAFRKVIFLKCKYIIPPIGCISTP